MAVSYLERITNVHNELRKARKLLNIYKLSRMNSGWLGTENSYENMNLSEFNIFINNENFATPPIDAEVTFYDIPMLCRGYLSDGSYSAGAPADIGFTNNVETERDVQFNWVASEIENAQTSHNWCSVVYGNGRYLIYDNSGAVAYSTDGINWTLDEIVVNENDYSCDIASLDQTVEYLNGYFIRTFNASNGIGSISSSDGIVWDKFICDGFEDIVAISSISKANGILFYTYKMGLGAGVSTLAYSRDGINWNEVPDVNGEQFIFVDNKYFGFNENGTCAYSYDLETWETTSVGFTVSNICSNGNVAVVKISDNQVAVSTDGFEWSIISFDPNYTYSDLCYTNKVFILKKNGASEFIYSIDGFIWETGELPIDNDSYAIGSGNSTFVIVGTENSTLVTPVEHVMFNKFHAPLYAVSHDAYGFNTASLSANPTIGGTMGYELVRKSDEDGNYINEINIYPNFLTEATSSPTFEDPVDEISVKIPDSYFETNMNNLRVFNINPLEGANALHNMCLFISCNEGGLRLYVTSNFLEWNIHEIISESDFDKFNIEYLESRVSDYQTLQSYVERYFRILPNGNYLVMYPAAMYDGTDKETMCYMYSPYVHEPIAAIKDPYEDTREEYQDKALKGISCYLTENGEVVLYYNERFDRPMVLYRGRVMSTFENEDYNTNEIVDVPVIDRTVDSDYTSSGKTIDLAIASQGTIVESGEQPIAAVNLLVGDLEQNTQKFDMGGNDYQKTQSISIYLDNGNGIDTAGNVDDDYDRFIVSNEWTYDEYVDYIDRENSDPSWISGTISNTARDWRSVCYGKDKFVAVASSTNYFAYSYDGITWTARTISSTTRQWTSVCYGKDKFVSVSGSSATTNFVYSYDGITWIEDTISSTARTWYSVCYGKDKFIAVSSNNISNYSYDGITWIELPMSGVLYYASLCYGNGKFVATSRSTNSTNRFAYIYNFGNSENFFGIANDKIMLAYANKSLPLATTVIGNRTSAAQSMGEFIEGTISSTIGEWNSVCYGKDKFVAIANGKSVAAYSYDGINWVETNIGRTANWNSVCYGNDKFIAVPHSSAYYAYSSDGITWTWSTISVIDTNKGICYGKDKFVVTSGGSATIAYSYDGITWTSRTLHSVTSLFLSCVCYGNDKFVTVYANMSMFAYSHDGITWTNVTISETTRTWTSLCYGKDKFVAVATSSNIFAYSYDGITWIEINIGRTANWSSVCYGNNKFVAVIVSPDTSNIFMYSYDGITWIEDTIIASSGNSWHSICYGNNKFVAVDYLKKHSICAEDNLLKTTNNPSLSTAMVW